MAGADPGLAEKRQHVRRIHVVAERRLTSSTSQPSGNGARVYQAVLSVSPA